MAVWQFVCIRACVCGSEAADGRCIAEGGQGLDAEGLVEMAVCSCGWSCWCFIMQLVDWVGWVLGFVGAVV